MKNTPSKAHAALLLALVALASTGCKILPERKPRETQAYFLEPEIEIAPVNSRDAATTATLLVSPPRARAGFDTNLIAYTLRPYTIEYYASNEWTDAPAQLLAPSLVRAMEKSGIWSGVSQASNLARSDYRLDIDDLAIVHDFLSQPSRVRLSLRAQLIRLRGQSVIASKRVEIEQPAPSEDAYGGVLAANQAVGVFLKELVSWTADVMRGESKL